MGGGAPDLFVELKLNGSLVYETLVNADSFSATFAGPFSLQVIAGSSLELIAQDEDLSANDHVYTCQAAPLTTEQLRRRELQCASMGYSLRFRIEPR